MVEVWEPGPEDDYDPPWEMGTPTKKPYLCKGGTEPVDHGPKNNWYTPLPGFWLPNSWTWTEDDFPDYTADAYVRALTDPVAWDDLVRLGPPPLTTRQAWGAWLGAWGCDRQLKRGWPELETVARARYESARYKYLVPYWSRKITEVLGELDDLEDQLSTILWVLEMVGRKWVPVPPGLLGIGKQTARSLDCAQTLLAGATGFRAGKSKYVDCIDEVTRKKAVMRTTNYTLLGWLQDNFGHILEAAQASNTWSDVGLVLGPLFAWMEEGAWGLIREGAEGYNLGIEAVFPGYIEERNKIARALDEAIEERWDATWGSLDEWDNEQINEWIEPAQTEE